MARVLWAFQLDIGKSEQSGSQAVVDDMAGSEGFVFVPEIFPAVFAARTATIRSLIRSLGTTHTTDHAEILDQAGEDRMIRLGKK